MARIAYAAREDLPPALHPLMDDAASYGPFASLVGALGRRPVILEHTFGLLTALRREAVLPRRYLELAWSRSPNAIPATTAWPITGRC